MVVTVQQSFTSTATDSLPHPPGTTDDNVAAHAWRVRLRDAEHEVVSAIARGRGIHEILGLACERLEDLVPGAICSVLLLDATRTRFTLGAAPSLPSSYNNALEGLVIGPNVGSCGTAAYTLQTVVCGDIAADPKWEQFLDLARAHSLAACWSIPLLCATHRSLGSFAVYHRQPHWPEPWEIAVAKVLSDAVTVAISRHLDQQALIQSRDALELRVAERTRDLLAASNEAVRANSFKTRFLAAASHDLRQPLQSAAAYLAALSHRLEGHSLRPACDQLRRPLAAMDSILNALVDISRFENGAVRPDIRDFEIADVIDRCVTAHVMAAEDKELRIVTTPAAEVVHSDPALIERVLDNFISNAVRYTAQGEITVAAVREGDRLRVTVRDTGAGIPADKLDSIFEEYVQLENPNRDRRKGLGFGLAIVKLIARTLNHPIGVDSTVGRGSRFSIDLPISPAFHRAPAAAAWVAPPVAGRPCVLLVEDDPDCAFALREYLGIVGFEPIAAATGAEALGLIAAGLRPHFVISDYRLPGDDGLEVIRGIRAVLHSDVPAVLLSGDTSLGADSVASLADCAFMRKPAPLGDLTALITQLAPLRR